MRARAIFWRATQTTSGRVALLLGLVGAVTLTTAALEHLVLHRFDDYGDALWSAILHVFDPGSLDGDEGLAERAIGVFQVAAGLVLLVGLLFTLVTDSVESTIERLGRADPPVTASEHLLIVGGLDQLGMAAGAEALAAEMGMERSRMVILAPESSRGASSGLVEELRRRAAPLKVDLVFGDTAGESGFALAGAERAAKILLLPSTAGAEAPQAADVEVMQGGLALRDYLARREAEPEVRLLFRHGRHVDVIWDLYPPRWDAVVGDRILAAVLRVAMTRLEQVPEIQYLVDPAERGDARLLARAREAAAAEQRPLRLTVIGCGPNAAAQMEDLAKAGGFEVTMLAEPLAFERHLGRDDPSGLRLNFVDTRLSDPERLADALRGSRPDMVLVTPSPTGSSARVSDAEATLSLLYALRALGPRTPVLAELALRESVDRLPPDPRLLPVAAVDAISAALALALFDRPRSQALERLIAVED